MLQVVLGDFNFFGLHFTVPQEVVITDSVLRLAVQLLGLSNSASHEHRLSETSNQSETSESEKETDTEMIMKKETDTGKDRAKVRGRVKENLLPC